MNTLIQYVICHQSTIILVSLYTCMYDIVICLYGDGVIVFAVVASIKPLVVYNDVSIVSDTVMNACHNITILIF